MNVVSRTISDLYFTVNVQSVTVEPADSAQGRGDRAVCQHWGGTAALAGCDPHAARRDLAPLGCRAAGTAPAALLTSGRCGAQRAGLSAAAGADEGHSIVGFLSLFAFVLGGALFTPIVLLLLMRAATPLAKRLFGVLGRMAPRAVIRSLSRTSIAVAALTVAVSVIVGVSVMIGSFRNTVADWLDTTLGADIYVSPPLITATRSTVDVDPGDCGTDRRRLTASRGSSPGGR